MSRLENKVVLITGGGTGIGRAAAVLALQEGARVFVVGRRSEPLEALAAEHGDRVRWRSADVSAAGAAPKIIQDALSAFGRLDVLVNNAGTYSMAPVTEVDDEEITRVLQVNVAGPLMLMRAAVAHLEKQRGSIVNVSTTLTRGTMAGTASYAGSKAALEHITRIAATELGPRQVRVNAVSPGFTATDMSAPFLAEPAIRDSMVSQTPLQRVGEPADVARAIVWLATGEAAWVTGQVLQASGGLML